MTPVTMAPSKYPYDPENPSSARRKALLDGDENNVGIAVSSFFPITRYYDAAEKVLGAFEEAYAQDDLDSAFVFGKRYCTFVIEAIPKHNYYLNAKYADLRKKYTNDAHVVIEFLEKIKVRMDVEEREKYKKRLEHARIMAQRQEAERKRREAIKKEQEASKFKELVKRAEKQKQGGVALAATTNGDVQESAMNKLQMLMKQSSTTSVTPPPAPPASNNRPSGRYFLSDTDDDDDESAPPSNGNKLEVGQPLPPPLPPPMENAHSKSNGSLPPALSPPAAEDAPPSYDFATNPNRRNPFLGPSNAPYAVPPPIQTWGEPRPPSYSSLPDPPSKRYPSQSKPHYQLPAAKKKKKMPVRQLRDKARRQYQQLVNENRIEIRPVDTYQGRYSQSTNGCTVISPLVVARHLATSSGVVLPNQEIKHVIDTECGPLLREIRGKLGLDNHSLIIPSDVHDHLVDKNILKQDYFVGATGGNIISEEHMGEFIKLFQEKRKAGAALFFREHVVSIIKIPVGGNGQAYYDLVDSMPGTKDLRGNPCATRTRCKDEDALDVLLTWYATKKFSESNCSYIDNNDWNEMMADLDPRVFQAFVWGKDD